MVTMALVLKIVFSIVTFWQVSTKGSICEVDDDSDTICVCVCEKERDSRAEEGEDFMLRV